MFVSFFYLLMIFLVWFRFISVSFLVLQSPASQGIIRLLFIAKYNAYVRKETCKYFCFKFSVNRVKKHFAMFVGWLVYGV